MCPERQVRRNPAEFAEENRRRMTQLQEEISAISQGHLELARDLQELQTMLPEHKSSSDPRSVKKN